MNAKKLAWVRVSRNGQVRLPSRIREKMNVDVGSLLEIEERPDGILLRPLSGINIGKIIGRKKYDGIIDELDQLRG
jgi:AbrB family looped-hinge helix DNA binding protein